MIAASSVTAYRRLRDSDLDDRQSRVLGCIHRYPGMSSNEIARTLSRETGRSVSRKDVCSRISELLRDGRIMVSGEKRDRFTGRKVRQYVLCCNDKN